MNDFLRGIVLQAQSGFFTVETENGEYTCQIRGRLKKGRKMGDIIAIGDRVKISIQDEKTAMIEEVEPRDSLIYRMAPTARGEFQQIIKHFQGVSPLFFTYSAELMLYITVHYDQFWLWLDLFQNMELQELWALALEIPLSFIQCDINCI